MSATKSLAIVASLVGLSIQMGPDMDWPVNFGKVGNNAPVQPLAYPCNFGLSSADKLPLVENIIPLGEEQMMKFTTEYGVDGGSCQLSLTTDVPPTKDSVWKVLHSVEGGCPINTDVKSQDIPNDVPVPSQKFIIPNSIAPGNYSFAWS